MTEQEWQSTTSYDGNSTLQMVHFVLHRLSSRRKRLFACGCFRRHLHDESHALNGILASAERYADNDSTWNELASSRKRAEAMVEDTMQGRLRGFGAGFIQQLRGVAHPDADEAVRHANLLYDPNILREVVGNPFCPVTVFPTWQTANVVSLAQTIYDERAFDRMPILGDALEDAGCDNTDMLNHCRQPGEHVRGCWVVDLLLGKE